MTHDYTYKNSRVQETYVCELERNDTGPYSLAMSIDLNEPIPDLIARILRSRGWTQDHLAEALNVTQATVSRWRNGRMDPGGAARDRLRMLVANPNEAQAQQRVPLLSWISAGALAETASLADWEDVPTIEVGGLAAGDWIALEVDGDSMDRISPPKSIILVNRRDKRLVPNACYVVADEEGAATYKRWRPSPSRFEPVSTNPNHEPIYPTAEPLIVGRVRRSILEM